MHDPGVINELRNHLAWRRRLGLNLVAGDRQDLARLLQALGGPADDIPRDLESIALHMGQCTRCSLSAERRNIVFGQGPATARLMIIGEGPGQQEDRRGLPFVGPAGKLLERMLAAVGLKRGEVYITNIVKCRPPGNRDPRPEEVDACRPFLEAQVKAIAPAVILTLGRPAAQALLDTKAPISALRGRWQEFLGRPLLPTFHPAYLLRSPAKKREAYADLKEMVRRLEE